MATVPIEIWERIIDEVGWLDYGLALKYRNVKDVDSDDDNDGGGDGRTREEMLLRCALVCHAWRPRSLHLLYQFESRRIYCDRRLFTFIRALRQRPIHSPPILTLRLIVPIRRKVDKVPLRLLGPLGKDRLNISALVIAGDRLKVGRSSYDLSFHVLTCYRSVQSLHLFDISFDTEAYLARLILCFPALQDLNLAYISLLPSHDPHQIPVPFTSPKPPPKFRKLTVKHSYFERGGFWSWLVDSRAFVGLQDISLDDGDIAPFNIGLAAEVLLSCRNSIRSLKFNFTFVDHCGSS